MAQSSRVQARQLVWTRTWRVLVPVAFVLAGLVLLRPGVTAGPGQAQTQGAPDAALHAGQTVGQSFVTRQGGLMAIEVFLRPAAGTGDIALHLRADASATNDLATAHVAASAVTKPDYYRFAFPIQRASSNQAYFFDLAYTGAGAVAVASAAGSTYHDGAQYQNGAPHDAQTAFRPIFDRPTLLLELGRSALGWLAQLLLQLLLFALPGWALLDWLLVRGRLAWAEQLALGVGVTLALYPLLLLGTALVGLQGGAGYAWLPLLASAGYLVWRSIARRRVPLAARPRRTQADWLADSALVLVLGLAFVARMLTIQPFDAPLWGDSVQHSVMAQLFLDHGGLFRSWEPYAPYQSLTVQYGFPLFVALFSWASGIGSVAATLVVAQTLNMLAALTLYPLATRITGGNRWAGVGAVLVAALLSPMPAFYVNWGRDAQLAGQVVLPVALWLLWEALESERPWRVAVVAGAVLAGMGLVYYRMPFYYAAFVPALVLGWALPQWRFSWRRWRNGGVRVAVVGAVAIALLVPWALRVKGGALADNVAAGVTRSSVLAEVLADYQFWWTLTTYVPPPLLVLSAAALVWSLISRRWQVAALSVWIVALALIVAGRLLHIPGTALIQNIAVLIALYMPVSLLIGALLGAGAQFAGRWRYGAHGALVALALVALWGAAQQQRIGDQAFEYVTRPDTRAMAWVARSTPPEARFLVEGFSIWSGTTIVGADAGWWLPLLAGRANTMPPQYAVLNERPVPPDFTKRMVGLVNQIQRKRVGNADVLRTLCNEGITHVYVGQLQGNVGVDVNTRQLFSPAELAANPAFRELYHQDRVYVFGLAPQACSTQ